VVVLDRRTFPRPKVCAGWVTPQVFRDVGVTPEEYGAGRVCQPIRGFRVGLLGRPPVQVDYGSPVSWGVLRSEFDHFLLARAGARLVLGEPLASLERRGRGWVANGRLQAPLVVGAGGNRCPVAGALGLGAGGPLVAALEVEFRMTREQARACAVDPEVPELTFLANLDGYGWCFRKGDTLNVGLGREGSSGAAAGFASFVGRLVSEGRIPAPPQGLARGHAYRLWRNGGRALVSDRALVVGDAAGLAYPKSGEGIRPAIESGILAAQAILSAREAYAPADLAPYAERLWLRLGKPEGEHRGSSLGAGLRRVAARAVLGTPGLARGLLLDRWFLRRGERPLSLPPPAPVEVA
jgi:flavin-dependent dehydrogenase